MRWIQDIAVLVALAVFMVAADADSSPWSGAIVGLFVYVLLRHRD